MTNTIPALIHLNTVADYLRKKLKNKKIILLFAYNATGKTRLSMDFKGLGKIGGKRDTLYFNAFTEDLFTWDNDLESDECRHLRLNMRSALFEGIEAYDIENRVREVLARYATFNFQIRKEEITREEAEKELYHQSITLENGLFFINYIVFEREVIEDGISKNVSDIKISRGEENIFFWCFFLSIAQLAFDAESPNDPYGWVTNIYIDDPISSIDEMNLVSVACDLAQLLIDEKIQQRFVISTHHSLFFNVLSNALKSGFGRPWEKSLVQYFFRLDDTGQYHLVEEKADTPYAYHLSIIEELRKAASNNTIKVFHFNMMRSVLEKTSAFFGFSAFTDCIKDHPRVQLFARFLNLFSHDKNLTFAYREPDDGQKKLLKEVIDLFLEKYQFNLHNTLPGHKE
ncbi:MAG: AAA family ATPase [Leptonema illini]|uniref:AAA family ATPase n=1 Tax=Leptonema illini TaxID=183 RepID=A0A833GX65_9LEPT|nr:MAG: AAA family ATPase [Leptonema illini]